ncbi:MAG: flagellar type III secretion system pore protein FliP [Fimbriimonadaceae bacterium]|nr:flagellar type III secretion system pore protein FliP [Fimbriimonadaceae bacterium]
MTPSVALLLPTTSTTNAALFGITIQPAKQSDALGTPLQVVILLTALTVLPAILVSVTPFLRITIVLHFLRQALGTQTTPSNQVLVGLALFLTILLIQPVAKEAYEVGWKPMEQGARTGEEAWVQGTRPVKDFLLRFTREKDIALMLEVTKTATPMSPRDLDLSVLAPAYILSELKTGFQIGAVLFLPFLIIDIVVASVTLTLGMVQLPPVMVSAPFKILLFVLVDGWNLVIGSLLRSFR